MIAASLWWVHSRLSLVTFQQRVRRKKRNGTRCGRASTAMAWHAAEPSRADPEAAAELPADDPGAYEHLHAAPQYPGLLRLGAGRAAAADPPADISAVDAASPTAAAGLPAAGPGVDEHLHAEVQQPAFLRSGRVAECSEGNRRGADRGLRRDERR